MMRSQSKVTPSLPDLINDVEAHGKRDDDPSHKSSVKDVIDSEFLSETIDLLLLDTKNVLTYNIFLQFNAPKLQSTRISEEYYHFRYYHITIICIIIVILSSSLFLLLS